MDKPAPASCERVHFLPFTSKEDMDVLGEENVNKEVTPKGGAACTEPGGFFSTLALSTATCAVKQDASDPHEAIHGAVAL